MSDLHLGRPADATMWIGIAILFGPGIIVTIVGFILAWKTTRQGKPGDIWR